MYQISLNHVSKIYSGVCAVDSVSLTMQTGSIVALLGPNGAGKSSLIRMLVGLTRPDSGNIQIEWNGATHRLLPANAYSYLPEDRGLYEDRTVRQNIVYIGQLKGLDRDCINDQTMKWLARFDLTERADESLSRLSKGNQQKVQLIATLLGEPDLLVLDEPFSGLDPINQELILEILLEYRLQGKGVLLSAHQMALVERVADAVLLLDKGKTVAQGSLSHVRTQLQQGDYYQFTYTQPPTIEQLAHFKASTQLTDASLKGATVTIQLMPDCSLHSVLESALSMGEVVSMCQQQVSLHDLYLSALRSPRSRNNAQASDTREVTA